LWRGSGSDVVTLVLPALPAAAQLPLVKVRRVHASHQAHCLAKGNLLLLKMRDPQLNVAASQQ